MTVRDVDAMRETLMEFIATPRAWVLWANHNWSRCEHRTAVALFDTHEDAVAYVEASRAEIPHRVGGKGRSARPDSLLWDFNVVDGLWEVEPMLPWVAYDGGWTGREPERNPTPPLGPFTMPAADP